MGLSPIHIWASPNSTLYSRGPYWNRRRIPDSYIFGNGSGFLTFWEDVNDSKDLILLENQIPMFILDKLLGIGRKAVEYNVSYLAQRFFLCLNRGDPWGKICWDRFMNSMGMQKEAFHLLDLLHRTLITSTNSDDSPEMDFSPLLEMRPISHAKAVIKFKREREPKELLWDVKFKDGIIEISYVDMNMKSLMLNLCALEQCFCPRERKNYVTAFMIFMNYLICSPADVKHLRDTGIMRNDVGSDYNVVEFFKKLCQEVIYGRFNTKLLRVAYKFNEYCNNSYTTMDPELPVFDMYRRMDEAIALTEDSSNNICIYRIPKFLTELEVKAQYPHVVSLGPYHRDSVHLKAMEVHKWKALNNILKRNSKRIDDYIDVLKEHEPKARACYDTSINLSSIDFNEMMLLDGCFILEFLVGANKGFRKLGYSEMDPVFSISGFMDMIRQDFILLENQIPIIILEELHRINTRDSSKYNVLDLALRFFHHLISRSEPFVESDWDVFLSSLDVPKVPHLLGLVHWMFVTIVFDSKTKNPGKVEADKTITLGLDLNLLLAMRPVSYLQNHGIKFRRGSSSISSGIEFNRPYLKIPCILLDMTMKTVMLTLVAYEQVHSSQLKNNDVTSYMVFMDLLIDSGEDVKYLRESGIMMNSPETDSDVAYFFNHACLRVVYGNFNPLLLKVAKKLDECCKQKSGVWIKSLREDYFRSPWAASPSLQALCF